MIGRVATDPELRNVGKTDGNKVSVVNFILANNTFLGKDGDKVKEESVFILCEAWDSGAERLAELPKGTKILVEGTIRQDNWVDKETQKKQSRLKIRVERFEQLFPNPNKTERSEELKAASKKRETVPADTDSGEDIPF